MNDLVAGTLSVDDFNRGYDAIADFVATTNQARSCSTARSKRKLLLAPIHDVDRRARRPAARRRATTGRTSAAIRIPAPSQSCRQRRYRWRRRATARRRSGSARCTTRRANRTSARKNTRRVDFRRAESGRLRLGRRRSDHQQGTRRSRRHGHPRRVRSDAPTCCARCRRSRTPNPASTGRSSSRTSTRRSRACASN